MGNVVAMQPATATFDDFWRVYPRKIGKPLARAKWDAITNGGLHTRTLDKDSGSYVEINLQASPEQLIEAAKKYRDAQIDRTTFKLKDGGRFILHPATWLNQGRWEDET